jgi:hypothetical protein
VIGLGLQRFSLQAPTTTPPGPPPEIATPIPDYNQRTSRSPLQHEYQNGSTKESEVVSRTQR